MEVLFNGSDRLIPSEAMFFTGAGLDTPIRVRAVITELPPEFETNDKYLDALLGIDTNGNVVEELTGDCSPCLILQATIQRDSLPVWELLDVHQTARRTLRESDRAHFRFISLLSESDAHLTLQDRSVVRKSLQDRRDMDLFAVAALRNARLDEQHPLQQKIESAIGALSDQISTSGAYTGRAFGVDVVPDHRIRGGSWSLSDDRGVSLTSYGQGSKRLFSLALQEGVTGSDAVVAIDEIEIGLEPHRLSRLLGKIEHRIAEGTGQVFLTTHSQRVVEHFGRFVHIIRRSSLGEVVATSIPDELRSERDGVHGTVRGYASALLAEKVVILEGATEVGLVRRLFQEWDRSESEKLGSLGVEFVDAKGSSKIQARAKAFRSLKFDVVVVMDDDTNESSQISSALDVLGIVVCKTEQENSIEQEIFASLSREDSVSALKSVARIAGEETVIQRLKVCFGGHIASVEDLLTEQMADFSELLGIAVSGKKSVSRGIPKQPDGLFKNQDGGAILADTLIDSISKGNLRCWPPVLQALRSAVYPPLDHSNHE